MYGLFVVALCLLTGAMLAARGAWALLWTPLGFFIGLFVSSQVLLVLLMGLPRAGWLISKGYMRPSVVWRICLTPLIWLIIMFLVGFFWPSIVDLINNNLALSLGADLGMLAIILSPLSSKARIDFLDDFNTTYQGYFTESGRIRYARTFPYTDQDQPMGFYKPHNFFEDLLPGEREKAPKGHK